MKILAYYIADGSVRQRLQSAQQLQEAHLPWASTGIDRVLIAPPGELPVAWPCIHVDWKRDGHPLFALAKNAAWRFAEKAGYDWLLDMDADTVLLRTPSQFPASGYASVGCFFQQDAVEPITDQAERYEPSSRFLIARDLFTRFRFDERFWGYGGEDMDLNENILAPMGIYQTPTDARCVHVWHSRGPRPGNLDLLQARRANHRA